MNSYFSITADQLIMYNEKAHQEKQNYVLNIKDKFSQPELHPVELDVDKKVLVCPLLVHTNVRGQRAWRCSVTYGVKGQDKPEQSMLDLPMCFRRDLLQHPVLSDGTIGEPMTEHPMMVGSYAERWTPED